MKYTHAKTPLLLTYGGAAFFTVIAAFTIFRLQSVVEMGMAGITLVVYAAWMKWESHVSKNELLKEHAHLDGGTMEFAAFAKMTTLLIAFLTTTAIHPGLGGAGLIALVVGISIRASAIQTLGHDYSHRIRTLGSFVQQGGMYAFVRHPAYLGTFIAHLGFVLVFFSPYSLGSCLILWGAAVIIRCVKEEEVLQRDQRYQQYSQGVKNRLIPGIY